FLTTNDPMFRRDFLLTTLAVAAPAAAFAQDINWRRSCDVLVVGAGGAGLAAAVRASELGAEVILIEQNAHLGGNTLISGGFLGVVDPIRQAPLGITDSEEKHFQDIWYNGDKIANPALVRKLVHEAPRMLSWLEAKGVKFQDEVIEIYGSHFPRCHKPIFPNGTAYVRALSGALMQRKVNVLTETKAIELVEDDNGRIIGIKAASKGNEFFIRARKGVILAAGGFGANLKTVAAFDSRLKGLPSNCSSGSTGDMLFAARKIGASVVDLTEIQCLPGPISNKGIRVRFHNDVRRFVFVNDEGKRFVDERARRDELKEKILVQKNKSCYCIIDSDGLETLDLLVRRDAIRAAETGDAVKAQSLEELASALNIPAETLINTIKERNAEITSDKPQSRRFPILKAPFWAARVGMRIHYTMGGLQINEKAQCLKEGKTIPGLYAAGEITGGIHGRNRIGGNGLADAFTFGMIAAENLVSESQSKSFTP
ncbi:MAG: flavocytochrome c, partial [Parasutterella excrementihominis]